MKKLFNVLLRLINNTLCFKFYSLPHGCISPLAVQISLHLSQIRPIDSIIPIFILIWSLASYLRFCCLVTEKPSGKETNKNLNFEIDLVDYGKLKSQFKREWLLIEGFFSFLIWESGFSVLPPPFPAERIFWLWKCLRLVCSLAWFMVRISSPFPRKRERIRINKGNGFRKQRVMWLRTPLHLQRAKVRLQRKDALRHPQIRLLGLLLSHP